MSASRAANAEPIPGYRLIAPLGSGGFGEVWKCEAPGGLFKAVKFVRGDGDDLHVSGPAGAEQELRALQHVKALRHPFLLGMERVEWVDGELVIVMELADRSLHDLLHEYRESGLVGVPRAELLRYLGEAADALDVLNQEYGLQHLDVKPRNLFLVGRHVKVGDFGLVNSLAELSGSTPCATQMGAVTPLYAAPESFLGKVTLFSDQYSLAITYHELLVGAPPFTGKNFRQLALQHLQAEPDLGRLPPADRPVVARALAKEPRARFPSCTAFVEALGSGDISAPIGPPASAPSRPKPATRTDVPVVDLACTPVTPTRSQCDKSTPAEVVRTRVIPPTGFAAEAGGETRSAAAAPPGDGGGATAAAGRESMAPRGEEGRAAAAATAPPGDPLACYQFLECTGRNPASETWAARAPDGGDRLVRLFFNLSTADGQESARLARLGALRHVFLEPMEVVGGGERRLAVVTDPGPTSLAARLVECQAAALQGVPRSELLDRLGEAAEALDDLAREHGLHHLGLNPRCLALKNDRVRILYFGVSELVHIPAGHQPAALNPRYAAPELYEGRVHASSDIYSLALIYQELLTGVHPFRALSSRQLASGRHRGEPDLGLAPGPDRAALLDALHPDPAQRPQTCGDLIAALAAGGARRTGVHSRPPSTAVGVADLSMTPGTRSRMRRVINGLVAQAAGDLEVREYPNIRALLRPGRSLEHQFFARLPPGMAALRLDGFRQEWRAEPMSADQDHFAYLLSLGGGTWQRLIGRRSGLRIHIETPPPTDGLTEVLARIEAVRCGAVEAVQALEEIGPRLLQSLRTHLQALPERRHQARLPLQCPVEVAPVLGADRTGDVIVAQAKDISLRGMGLYMPCRPPSMLLQVRLPGEAPQEGLDVPACVVRAVPRPDGRFEVGVRFLVEEGNS